MKHLLGLDVSDEALWFWKKKALVVKLLEFLVDKLWWVNESLGVGKVYERLKPNWVWKWREESDLIEEETFRDEIGLRELAEAMDDNKNTRKN